ncbi:class I SAM-dependent methyltransferase [Lishizhenia tianjinensis]|nr:rRNA adenine N-6-methyltransferase family protein [Lishizhenia tianjinensis]
MVGAVSPSSRFLAKKMLEGIDFKTCSAIVELGPGTGVFTRRLLENLKADAKLFVFELNDDFYNNLKNELKDPRVILIHDSAENLAKHLNAHGVEYADVVISSLPLANFSDELTKSILSTSYKNLKKKGKYIQFQYSLQAKNDITHYFKEMHIKFTALNLPPAFVYTCTK